MVGEAEERVAEEREELGVCRRRRRFRSSRAEMIRRGRCEPPQTSVFLPRLALPTTLPIRSGARTASRSRLSKETGPRRRTTGCKSEFCFFSVEIDGQSKIASGGEPRHEETRDEKLLPAPGEIS